MTTKLFSLVSFLCLSFFYIGCADPNAPSPWLTGGTSDAGTMPPIHQQVQPSSTLPITQLDPSSNAYVCACRALIPLNCAEGCGTIFSGTGAVTLDGDAYCDSGLRNLRVCYRQGIDRASLTYRDLEQDCRTRVQENIREGLRFGFRNRCTNSPPGYGPCEIRYGCSALRLNGTVDLIREDRCSRSGGICGSIPLVNIDHSPWANYSEATYVRASEQYQCGQVRVDTSVVCGNVSF